jgi:tRNA 5-methylaminomethyl-2-thiouridine biosynthesis bifunctional protein
VPLAVRTDDAVVVGAGLAGAAAARALAQAGLRVTVLDTAAEPANGASGMPQVLVFPDVERAILALRPLLQPGDCVLAKASRSSRLERLFEALKVESIENH